MSWVFLFGDLDWTLGTMIFGAALSVGRASDLHEKPHSCSPRCRNLAKVRRHRSGYTVPPLPRYGRSGYRLSSLPLDGSQRFPPSFQSAWPHARSFTGRRLRTRILRGRLSQAAGMSRPKAEASYLGSRVEKFQKLMRADGAVAAKGRSHLAYGNIARGVRHGAV